MLKLPASTFSLFFIPNSTISNTNNVCLSIIFGVNKVEKTLISLCEDFWVLNLILRLSFFLFLFCLYFELRTYIFFFLGGDSLILCILVFYL